MSENRSPLRIYCKNCGAPAGFDIINQTYRCPNCGEVTGIQEANDAVYQWKNLQKENLRTSSAAERGEECPSGKLGIMSSMYTDPNYRRLGIATELLDRVVTEAKEYGCGTIYITASDMGVKLYESYGFKHNGNFMQYNF